CVTYLIRPCDWVIRRSQTIARYGEIQMPPKTIAYAQQGREVIRRGVRQLADAVKVTLGPRGGNVLFNQGFGPPLITRDGATVAKQIDLPDPMENIGAQMIKDVAKKTAKDAGDGTTTATIYAESIFEEGLKNITAGAEAMEVRRGIERAVAAVVEALKNMSVEVKSSEQMVQVATCAANHDENVGRIVAEAMESIGRTGVPTIEEGQSLDIIVDRVDGLQFDKGFLSPYFINEAARGQCCLEKPYILVHEKRISSAKDFLPLLEAIAQSGKPLLVIAEDVDGEALATLVVNQLRGTLHSAAVKAPGFGDRRRAQMEDIAIMTGARAMFESLGTKLENVSLADLGQAEKVIIEKEQTTMIGGSGSKDSIDARIAQIKKEMDLTTSDYDREQLEKRLAKLTGGVARIKIGGATELEVNHRKELIEDALQACRAALEEGVLPGGGVAVLRCLPALDKVRETLTGDQRIGVDIVGRAIRSPIKQIAKNAGQDGSIVLIEVLSSDSPSFGYNALTGEYGDLVAMGVIVPTKVERVALQNASSVAALLLTTDAVVCEMKTDDSRRPSRRSA
ncbi:MAG: chaperonin GroEL, partial [Phycisphaerae bacterium]